MQPHSRHDGSRNAPTVSKRFIPATSSCEPTGGDWPDSFLIFLESGKDRQSIFYSICVNTANCRPTAITKTTVNNVDHIAWLLVNASAGRQEADGRITQQLVGLYFVIVFDFTALKCGE